MANSMQLDPLAIVYWPGSRGDFLASFLLDGLTEKNYLLPTIDYMVPLYCKIHPDPNRMMYEVCRGALVSNNINTSLTPAEWKAHAKLMISAGKPVIRIQVDALHMIEIAEFLWRKHHMNIHRDTETIRMWHHNINFMMNNCQMDADIWSHYSHFITWEAIFDIDELIALYADVHRRDPPNTTITRAQANIEIQKTFLRQKK
jgi:hypothetical protein